MLDWAFLLVRHLQCFTLILSTSLQTSKQRMNAHLAH